LAKQVRHAEFIVVNRGNWLRLSLAAGFAALLLLGLPGRKKRFKTALGLSLACLLFLALGCGGGGSSGGGGGSSTGGGAGSTTPQPTSISIASSNAKAAYGTSLTITATITATKPLTGTVSLYSFGTLIAPSIPVTGNQALIPQGNWLINVGLYQLIAKYDGDSNNLASTSSPLTQVITGSIPIPITGYTGVDFHVIPVTVGLQ
jgi:hypothetical protein